MSTRKQWHRSKEDLGAESIDALVEHCDVTSIDSLNAVADKAADAFGGIDLVFANAGIGAGETGAMWDYSGEEGLAVDHERERVGRD